MQPKTGLALRHLEQLIKEYRDMNDALRTIAGAFWTDGESYKEQIEDLKDIAIQAIVGKFKRN